MVLQSFQRRLHVAPANRLAVARLDMPHGPVAAIGPFGVEPNVPLRIEGEETVLERFVRPGPDAIF